MLNIEAALVRRRLNMQHVVKCELPGRNSQMGYVQRSL